MTWREYHELTKHTAESLRRTQHFLDWANLPNPFRHYEGVPMLDLPADPPPLLISAVDALQGRAGTTEARDGATFLSQLTASISATKRVRSTGIQLCSPRESLFRQSAPNRISLLHARPGGLARRALPLSPLVTHGRTRAIGKCAAAIDAPLVFVLTRIAWRVR